VSGGVDEPLTDLFGDEWGYEGGHYLSSVTVVHSRWIVKSLKSESRVAESDVAALATTHFTSGKSIPAFTRYSRISSPLSVIVFVDERVIFLVKRMS
jgi:hypothetical protein